MVEFAVTTFTQIMEVALPIAIVFELGNLIVGTFMRAAFGRRLWFRKISMLVCVLALIFALGVTAQAATHSVYDGSISSTYTTYFKDILSGVSFNDNYVAFRSGQYEYTMVVGDLSFNGSTFTLEGQGKEYVFSSGEGYNSYYQYYVSNISNFSLNVNNSIIYSDLGDYPQLMERGG